MSDDHPHNLRRRIAAHTFRTLRWGRDHVPPGIRSLIGVGFAIGGIFGFLPVLGFWMLPLGAAFIALDIPSMRHKIDKWMVRLQHTAAGDLEIQSKPDPDHNKSDKSQSSD